MSFPGFREIRPVRVLKTLIMLSLLLPALPARAGPPDLLPDGYRLQHAIGKFSDTTEFAGEYRLRAPQWLRAERLEVAVGALADGEVTRPFLSVGPVWRWHLPSLTYLEFGFSPTLLSDATVDDRSLGGHLHFTSSLSIGRHFGDRDQYTVAVRAQHVSNGGLDSRNPGIDVVGLRFAWEFPD